MFCSRYSSGPLLASPESANCCPGGSSISQADRVCSTRSITVVRFFPYQPALIGIQVAMGIVIVIVKRPMYALPTMVASQGMEKLWRRASDGVDRPAGYIVVGISQCVGINQIHGFILLIVGRERVVGFSKFLFSSGICGIGGKWERVYGRGGGEGGMGTEWGHEERGWDGERRG